MASVEPGVEAAARPGIGPAGVRSEGGLGEAAARRGRALETRTCRRQAKRGGCR